jgi:5-methylcytosine-specific restriction endonuclease McrA
LAEEARRAAPAKQVGVAREVAWEGRRTRIFRRDGFRCVYCGLAAPAPELTLDHVEPRMRGGDHSEGNLVTCCQACNRMKGGQPAWSFLPRHPELLANFLAATAAERTEHAAPVWRRLRRAVEESAARPGG